MTTSTKTIGNVSITLIDETSCRNALETLAAKHHLTASHPFVKELQELIALDDVDDFPVYLVHRAAGNL